PSRTSARQVGTSSAQRSKVQPLARSKRAWCQWQGRGASPTPPRSRGEAPVRAAIVEREETTFVVGDEDRGGRPRDHQPPLSLQLLEAARAHEIRGRYVHQQFLSAIVLC